MNSRSCFILMAATMVALVGCGTDEVAPEQDTPLAAAHQAAMGGRPPPNGANGTRPSCFWAAGSQQVLRSLGTDALDQGGGVLTNIPLTQLSADCREVLRSAVECALAQDQSVRDPVTGELYMGWWGLAPSWLGSPLDVDGRRYVTACMVQRLNYYGTSVPILLEGPNSAITRSSTWAPEYPILESTVFGDLFSSTNPLNGVLPAFDAYVCWEGLMPQSCGLLGLPLLFEKRICDDAILCGLQPVGPCALSCSQNGPYWQCWPSLFSSPWKQTVRVRLEEDSCQ